MRFKKEPSGKKNGRGQYEVRDKPADIAQLVEKSIHVAFLGTVLDSQVVLRKVKSNAAGTQFKHRLRILDKSKQTIHFPWQIAAALMLPRLSSEEEKWAKGTPVFRNNRFTVKDYEVTKATAAGNRLNVKLGALTFQNATKEVSFQFSDRVRLVGKMWKAVGKLPAEIAEVVKAHRSLVRAGGRLMLDCVEAVDAIQTSLARHGEYTYGTDCLPHLLRLADLEEDSGSMEDFGIEDLEATPDVELRFRVLKKYALRAVRTSGHAAFKKGVLEAYDYTCVACGQRLPSPGRGSPPGVDAAHILSWSEYDLDKISNGVCLCKQHHWAFDAGLIELTHQGSEYRVVVPAEAVHRVSAGGSKLDLSPLQALQKKVPDRRLPVKRADRPKPQFLAELRKKRWPT